MNTEELVRLASGVTGDDANGSGAEIAQPEVVANAEDAVEKPVASAENAAPEPTPVQTNEIPAAAAAEGQEIDYWKHFDEKTGGLVKDEESLNSILERYKKYDEILKEKEEIEASQFKPANDYVKTLNKLIADGADSGKVKAFMKLNEWGDLKDLSAAEALVMQKVLVNGFSEEIARYRVNQEFNLEEIKDLHGEDSIEYRSAVDEMRVTAEKAKAELAGYRAELTTVDKPVVSENEQKYLDMVADNAAYTASVNGVAGELAKTLPSKVSVGGIDFSLPKEFESKKTEIVKDFFYSTGLPVNKESSDQLEKYLKVRAFVEYEEKIVDHIKNTLESELTEKISNKYENRSGLPQDNAGRPQISSDGDSMESFYKQIGALR